MDLTSKQRTVLLSLTTEWQTPIKIANKLPEASLNLSDIQQVLQDLLRVGLVQINPVVLGLYRLSTDGITLRELEWNENQN